jgi:hypothetical protein
LLSDENIGSRFVVPTVAGCVDIVVHLESGLDGSRRIREIVAVPGRVEGEVVELEPIFLLRGDRLLGRTDTHRTPTASDAPVSIRPTHCSQRLAPEVTDRAVVQAFGVKRQCYE